MVVSPLIFGGIVIGLWHLWERNTSAREEHEDDGQKIDINEPRALKDTSQDHVASSNAIGADQTSKKFLDPYRRHGAMLMLVSLCVLLQLFSQVVLKNAGPKFKEKMQ